MDVLGHDHVAEQGEVIAVAHISQDFQKEVTGARRGEQRLSAVTTAGDEVEMSQAVTAFQTMLDQVEPPHSLQNRQRMWHPLFSVMALRENECDIIGPGVPFGKTITDCKTCATRHQRWGPLK